MAFTNLRAAARDPRQLLQAVGLMMVGRSQRAFTDQGRDGAWSPRAVPNRVGVILDLQEGRNPPERRWDARPAGIDSGRLRSSIAFKVQGARVVVGSSLPYASDVQRGSSKTIPLDRSTKHALAAWIRGLGGARKTQAQRAFGPLFRQSSLSVVVPPRPFLVLTQDDRRDILALAKRFFDRGGSL